VEAGRSDPGCNEESETMKRMMSGVAILAMALTVSPVAAQAQRRGAMGTRMGRGGPPENAGAPGIEGVMRMRDRLELTEAQIQQLEQIRQEAVERRNAHRSQMDELRSRVMAGQADAAELREQIEANRANSEEIRQAERERVEAILNEGQRNQLQQMRDRAQAFRMGRRSALRGEGRGMGGARPGMRPGMRGGRGFRPGAGMGPGRGFRGVPPDTSGVAPRPSGSLS
jgi:Spy/CpxP family protein refolding chaperone